MKTVVESKNVAHLWMHKAQAEARNSNRSFWFEGDTIYSYGRHFPIARHVTNKKGVAAVLFASRDYSITTSKHKDYVRQAIPSDVPIFFTNDVNCNPSDTMLDEYQASINNKALIASRARSNKEWRLTDVDIAIERFNLLAHFIGSRRKPKTPSAEWIAEQTTIAREAAKAERENRREKEEIRRKALAQARAEALGELRLWKQGGNAVGLHVLDFDYMRLDGDEIETTRGARVPIDHVKRIVPLIIKMLDNGETYQRNGHSIHVGPYVLERLDTNGVLTVGCHKFEAEELRRIAALLYRFS